MPEEVPVDTGGSIARMIWMGLDEAFGLEWVVASVDGGKQQQAGAISGTLVPMPYSSRSG